MFEVVDMAIPFPLKSFFLGAQAFILSEQPGYPAS